MNAHHFDPKRVQVHPHAIGKRIYSMFGGTIHISIRIYFFACDRADIDDGT